MIRSNSTQKSSRNPLGSQFPNCSSVHPVLSGISHALGEVTPIPPEVFAAVEMIRMEVQLQKSMVVSPGNDRLSQWNVMECPYLSQFTASWLVLEPPRINRFKLFHKIYKKTSVLPSNVSLCTKLGNSLLLHPRTLWDSKSTNSPNFSTVCGSFFLLFKRV